MKLHKNATSTSLFCFTEGVHEGEGRASVTLQKISTSLTGWLAVNTLVLHLLTLSWLIAFSTLAITFVHCNIATVVLTRQMAM